jgi:NitT/TauT family transport system substrate-binding protein
MCASLLAIAPTARAATLPRIQVAYTNTVSCAGLFIASDQGMFTRHGLDVQPLLIALNSTVPAALIGGSVQLGTVTPSVMLLAVDGGLDLVVIAGGAVNDIHNPNAGVVARAGVAIQSAKDFEGKRVGVPGFGAYMHVMFRRWLTEHGADDRKVHFIEVPLAQEADLLRSGNVDAVVSGEPFFNRIIQSKVGYLVAPFFTEMPDGLYMMYFAATRDWASRNPALLTAFRAALEEASVFLASHPAEARQIVGKYTHLPPEIVNTLVLPSLRLEVPVADLRYWADTLLTQGVIRSRLDATRLVVN